MACRHIDVQHKVESLVCGVLKKHRVVASVSFLVGVELWEYFKNTSLSTPEREQGGIDEWVFPLVGRHSLFKDPFERVDVVKHLLRSDFTVGERHLRGELKICRCYSFSLLMKKINFAYEKLLLFS